MKKQLFCILFVFSYVLLKSQAYVTTTVVSGLSYPVAFTFAPTGEVFVTEKAGVIKKFSSSFASLGTFYNLSDSTFDDFERGLLGIEVDPDYATNGFVYAYYNHRCCNPSPTGSQFIRIVRFTDVANVGTNPTVILSIPVSNSIPGNHVGGNLRFRPSEPNKIYLSIGELATPSNSQLLSNPFGKILRINKDGTIPTDNPFYDNGNVSLGNDDRIWSYGHRNPFDFSFSTLNDSLYISENGAVTWDEVNYGRKGKNYGWQGCEGFNQYNSTSPCTNPNYTNPMVVWGSPLPAITGIVHYTSNAIPSLTNHLLVGDNDYGRIYDLVLGNAPFYDTVLSKTQMVDLTASGTGGLTTLKQGNNGCIYAMNGGYTANGRIFQLCPPNVSVAEGFGAFAYAYLQPNPSSETATLKFKTNHETEISLQLSDLSGREIFKMEGKSLLSQENEIQISVKDLPNGIYILNANGSNEKRVLRLVVNH